MYKPIYGICICHGKKRLLVVKSGHCKQGNYDKNRKTNSGFNKKEISIKPKRIDITKALCKKNKKPKKIQHRKKGTGEKQVFEAILKEREHTSQISGTWLGEGFNPWWFSHIVPKSIAPRLRLDPRNIILMTPDEHQIWENKKHTIRDNPKWKWIFELEEKLKIEYYNK